jgi:hypothetical protein
MKELLFENKKWNGCNEIFSVIRRDVGTFDCNWYVWLFITAYSGADSVAVLPVLKKT